MKRTLIVSCHEPGHANGLGAVLELEGVAVLELGAVAQGFVVEQVRRRYFVYPVGELKPRVELLDHSLAEIVELTRVWIGYPRPFHPERKLLNNVEFDIWVGATSKHCLGTARSDCPEI